MVCEVDTEISADGGRIIMNSLKVKYNLFDELSPTEKFWKSPSLKALCCIPKEQQTAEMIDKVIDEYNIQYDMRHGSLLKCLSKKVITHQQLKKILEVNGNELEYVADRHITLELVSVAIGSCWQALRWTPEKFITYDICTLAINGDGRSLAYVPKKMRTYELCLLAVNNDHGDDRNHALKYVPRDIIYGEKGRCLCEVAVSGNGLALANVPDDYLTPELIISAIENEPSAIEFVPKRFMNKEIVELSLSLEPNSIVGLPSYATKFVTDDVCIRLIDECQDIVQVMPAKFLARKKVADYILERSPEALRYIPEKLKTRSRCFDAKERDPKGVSITLFPEKVLQQWEELHPEDARVETLKEAPIPQIVSESLPLPSELPSNALAVKDVGRLDMHRLDDECARPSVLYYISDIHLEHQIDFTDCTAIDDVRARISAKVKEMLAPLTGESVYILLGGDIANSVELTKLFYEALAINVIEKGMVDLKIISVLGNHELWDVENSGRSVEDIVEDYRNVVDEIHRLVRHFFSCEILENALYVMHKNSRECVISEEDILASNPVELKELCEESSLIILGGLGYSGRNPVFNASMDLYRDTLALSEDVVRSRRFELVYEKLVQCAGDKRVIVLTHTPVQDWLSGTPKRNWVYVNGHTHRNGMILEDGGPAILFDNQVGYEPKAWQLKSIELELRYDPFEKWEDGIYSISSLQYREFNRGRGIFSEFNRAGTPYVAKHSGLYMFFLERDNKTYMLEGGKIHTVDHPISWYYSNMPQYAKRVRIALEPYFNALQRISEETRSFGGWGTRHGCIVDINYFNHIYLNPFDGTITPYFAWNTTRGELYNSVKSLLSDALSLRRWVLYSFDGSEDESRVMLQRYSEQEQAGNLVLLSSERVLSGRDESLAIPDQFLDHSTYEASRIMRSIQYLIDGDVIRIWRDSILDENIEGMQLVDNGLPCDLNGGKGSMTLPENCGC